MSFVSEGDFANSIDNIFLRMTYVDALNNYQQSSDYTFSTQNRSHDWVFPVLGAGQGKISYSGVISYKNHTTENISETTVSGSLVTFGPPSRVRSRPVTRAFCRRATLPRSIASSPVRHRSCG